MDLARMPFGNGPHRTHRHLDSIMFPELDRDLPKCRLGPKIGHPPLQWLRIAPTPDSCRAAKRPHHAALLPEEVFDHGYFPKRGVPVEFFFPARAAPCWPTAAACAASCRAAQLRNVSLPKRRSYSITRCSASSAFFTSSSPSSTIASNASIRTFNCGWALRRSSKLRELLHIGASSWLACYVPALP